MKTEREQRKTKLQRSFAVELVFVRENVSR